MTRIARIEGYAAVYGAPDLSGDIIAPGAFRGAAPAAVRMLYQHAADAPIGRWTGFEERPRGLYAWGEIDLVGPRQAEIHGLLRAGALDGLSVGYRTARARRAPGGRKILEAELWEVSVVTFPMARGARIAAVGPAIAPDEADAAITMIRRARDAIVA
ncbi:MAG: HK97 family phage prohead protease [Alphaproteobacteria bacterium]|nr:HK97 family phage prohead protease [Alphaproteobacteria bacterium]